MWILPQTYWIRIFILPKSPDDLLLIAGTEALSYQLGSKKTPLDLSLGLSFPNCRMKTASASVPSQGCCVDQKAGGMWKSIVNCTVLYKGQNQTVNQSIKALETIWQTDNAFYLPGLAWPGRNSQCCVLCKITRQKKCLLQAVPGNF